jgi:hypothetical protein
MHLGFKVGTRYSGILLENLEEFQPQRPLAKATSAPTDCSVNARLKPHLCLQGSASGPLSSSAMPKKQA